MVRQQVTGNKEQVTSEEREKVTGNKEQVTRNTELFALCSAGF
jgi:hypothetical protein